MDMNYFIKYVDENAEQSKKLNTHIKISEDYEIKLAPRGLTVIASGQGHGKTKLSIAAAYSAAVENGANVVIYNFSDTDESIWSTLISIESSKLGFYLEAYDIYGQTLNENQYKQYEICYKSLKDKLSQSGGSLVIMSSWKLRLSSSEQLINSIKEIVDADLVIIDSVEEFEKFEGLENRLTKVNKAVVELELLSKTYQNCRGLSILLVTNITRTPLVALEEFIYADNDLARENKLAAIERMNLLEYNQLERKGSLVLALYSDSIMSSKNNILAFVIKDRIRRVSKEPLNMSFSFAYGTSLSNENMC